MENQVTAQDTTVVQDLKWACKNFSDWTKGFMTWDNLFRLIGIVVIFFGIIIAYKFIVRSIKKIPEKKLPAHRAMIVLKFLKYAYYCILIMFILSLFGIKLKAIWGAAGVAGIAVAFAAQTSVSNIISGLFVIAEKALKIGDLITVSGVTGIVDNISLLSVKVHTLDNQMIRIPNSTVINSTLKNTSYFEKRRLDIQLSVAYDTDMEKALDVLATAPKYCKSVLKDPAPLVWFDGFADSGINLTLAVWFKSADFLAAKNETFIAIKRVYDEAGIEIPYSKLDVKVYDSESQFLPSAAKAKASARTKAPAKKTSSKKIDRKIKGASKATKKMILGESAKGDDDDDD